MEKPLIPPEKLSDWGEFRIIDKIILPNLKPSTNKIHLGDDCSFLPLGDNDNSLIMTCDACPKPLVWQLGFESYHAWGWYSVAINVSDLACAGAKPLAFLSSVEAPSDMCINDLREFYKGVADACIYFELENGGGNLRTASQFGTHGTAIGSTKRNIHIGRSGCNQNDLVAVIGKNGRFIATYLAAKSKSFNSLSEQDKNILCYPCTQIKPMQILTEANLVKVASDNSDGLLGSLWNIVDRSCVGIEIDLDMLTIDEKVKTVAADQIMNPLNLALCWGDWQVVVVIPSTKEKDFRSVCMEHNIENCILGRIIERSEELVGIVNNIRYKMLILRNENFSPKSYNNTIDDHLDYMLRTSFLNPISK
jgi:thiamine-monophosphate kinase